MSKLHHFQDISTFDNQELRDLVWPWTCHVLNVLNHCMA